MKWREVEPGVYWLLFEDSPGPTRREDGKLVSGRTGECSHPPSMVIEWCGRGCCVHLWSYSNGAEPNEEPGHDEDYLHICDVDDLIAELQGFKAVAGWQRPEWDERETTS